MFPGGPKAYQEADEDRGKEKNGIEGGEREEHDGARGGGRDGVRLVDEVEKRDEGDDEDGHAAECEEFVVQCGHALGLGPLLDVAAEVEEQDGVGTVRLPVQVKVQPVHAVVGG